MRLVLLTLFLLGGFLGHAQQAGYFDAAQAYNRLLLEKNGGRYTQIGNYKVNGTPYLFGEKVPGHMFAKGEKAYNLLLNYNTFDQQLGFFSSANPTIALEKDPDLVDSFMILRNADLNLSSDLRFINGRFFRASSQLFYNVMYEGPRYTLLKHYKSELGIVSTNYIDATLRQFNLGSEYYYYEHATQALKKVKANQATLTRTFGKEMNISNIVDKQLFISNPDQALIMIFAALNK